MPYDPRITAEVRAKAREKLRLILDCHDKLDAHLDQAINAILAEVVGPERVIVPREPTRAMWAAMGDAVPKVSHEFNGQFPAHDVVSDAIYRAMISASQEGNDGDFLARSLKETGR